jgi:hypothetical protein
LTTEKRDVCGRQVEQDETTWMKLDARLAAECGWIEIRLLEQKARPVPEEEFAPYCPECRDAKQAETEFQS